MIPKVVHYCWMSQEEYPAHIVQCIDSWKKRLPDYQFTLWNYDSFPKGKSIWVDEAFSYKKYAFCADYLRLYALYNYGGIYLDCDVEVLKSFDPFLEREMMISWQKDVPGLEVAAFGVEAGNCFIGQCLERYQDHRFIKSNGELDTNVLPEIVESVFRENGFDFSQVLPSDYFSPKSYLTKQIQLTENTYCIHHFDGSWKKVSTADKVDDFLCALFHIKRIRPINGIIRRFRKVFCKHQ